MSYADVDELVRRYGENTILQLTDDTRSGQIKREAAETALADAQAEIDGYLIRYKLPFQAAPRILTVYCCDIAVYRLATGMRQLTEDMQSRYDAAVAFLKQVAAGRAALSGLPDAPQPPTGDAVVFNEPQKKVFGRDCAY